MTREPFGLFHPFTKPKKDGDYLGYHVINKPEPDPEKESVTDRQDIGDVCNEYGGLIVAKIGDNKYGWLIENYNNSLNDASEYEIIPQYLYDALVKFESEREK